VGAEQLWFSCRPWHLDDRPRPHRRIDPPPPRSGAGNVYSGYRRNAPGLGENPAITDRNSHVFLSVPLTMRGEYIHEHAPGSLLGGAVV